VAQQCPQSVDRGDRVFDVAGTASRLHANYPGAQGIPKTFRSRRQWFPASAVLDI